MARPLLARSLIRSLNSLKIQSHAKILIDKFARDIHNNIWNGDLSALQDVFTSIFLSLKELQTVRLVTGTNTC